MKRMFDKEEIVDLIQEESPKIEVDSELSETSENPVQNKVIYGALEDKQDALPDTTGETGKFLKVGSDGLEWANLGGSNSLLCLSMTVTGVGTFYGGIILPKKVTPYTVTEIAQYLYDNNHKSAYGTLKFLFEDLKRMTSNNNNLLFYNDYGLFSNNGTNIQIGYSSYNQVSFTVTDGVISISVASGGGVSQSLNTTIVILAEF